MQISKLQLKTQNFLKSDKGFSLIEMLVAVAVFATSATIASNALVAASDAQQKILSLKIVQDNLSYAFDTIGKEVRTGTSYHCGSNIDDFIDTPRDCVEGGVSFTFRNAARPSQKITYRLNNGRLERVYEGGTMAEAVFVLTAPEANATNFKFYVQGSNPKSLGDLAQPRVTVILQGTAGAKEKIKSRINIQTTISQRLLDS